MQLLECTNITPAQQCYTARSLKRELQRGTRQIKDSTAEKTKEQWQGKRMHGNLDEKLVDNEESYGWLKFGDVKGEIESGTVAAQDQAISTTILKIKF